MIRPAFLAPALATLALCARGAHAEETLERADDPVPEAVVGGGEAHTDLVAGVGLLTAGVGISLGHRFENALRAEIGAGTLGVLSGASAGFGGSFVVLSSGKHRLEVPMMTVGLQYLCGTCGTDGATVSGRMLGLVTGLDWLYGQDGAGAGFVLSMRLGAGGASVHDEYDDAEDRVTAVPVVQLGAGWAF